MNPLDAIRTFYRKLGPVEQAQIVSSTAVIVSMATIVAALVATNQEPRLMDFVSLLTIGLIGFTSVYFTLNYARQLDEQRKQSLALIAVAESINRVVDLDSVLQTALTRTTDLLNTGFGWIYMVEDDALVLKCSRGSSIDFLSGQPDELYSIWLHQPRVHRARLHEKDIRFPTVLKDAGIQFWASIPLKSRDTILGTMIVAGHDFDMFTGKQAELMEAVGNQISVAVKNAQLFSRVRQSEQRYADLFENSPDIYLNVNRDHGIDGCNTTGALMLGRPKQEFLGKPAEDLFPMERREAIRQVIENMFVSGNQINGLEDQMLTQTGEPLHVSINCTLHIDEKSSSMNARLVARDITERKKMEAAILHAQKIDSIGSLAGGIAHDFNNILASILGSASIMRRRMPENEKLFKYVEIVEGAARRGSSLTRQLLTFARKTETFTTAVDVNTLITDTLQMFERSIDKNIVIHTSLTTDSALIFGDEGQVQQALLNLFLNARDAMPDGGRLDVNSSVAMVDAHTTSQFTSVKAGPFIAVTVTDTGKGIDKAIQSRIFEPFFTTKDHGTGLGLSVLYGVVQNHGGFIDMESSSGAGTTFRLYFPRGETRAQSARRQRPKPLPRGSEHILIIEDEESVSTIARDLLSDLGYTVQAVPDGQAGVELYRTRRGSIDLILLDMNMPLMGGKEAFENLRQIEPRCKIIILTGYGKKVIEPSSFPGQVNGFIQKPFQIEVLARTIRDVLDTRAVETELTT